jgi:hypothetical protein
MEWADKAVECVVGAVVPIVTPTYEANQMKKYYDNPDDGIDGFKMTVKNNDKDSFTFSGASIAGKRENFESVITTALSHGTNYYILQQYDHSSEKYVDLLKSQVSINSDPKLISPVPGMDMGLADNRAFYNTLCKIAKYNTPEYAIWMSKMYKLDSGTGTYAMKSSVVGLYF